MKFPFRAASFAAIVVAAAGTLAATTPTIAQEQVSVPVAQDTNGRADISVPAPAPQAVPQVNSIVWMPGEIVQPLPAESEEDATDAARTEFASLAAAVDAHHGADDLNDELRCLATGVYFESKGEPLAGQLAVADVILNRSQSGRFPGSVCSVLTQRGQFSFVRGGKLPSVNPGSKAWKTAVAVARVAQAEAWESPTDGALFFHARYVSPRWRLARVGSVGNHIFYR